MTPRNYGLEPKYITQDSRTVIRQRHFNRACLAIGIVASLACIAYWRDGHHGSKRAACVPSQVEVLQ